jgi:lipopolysaccharide transport system permease protein
VAQFWMLLTPVVYPPRQQGMAGVLATWNPVAPVLTTTREALTGVAFTQLTQCLFITAGAVVVCVLALLVYRLVMPLLIERMGG